MNIAFTLCSINYLAQANSLHASMQQTNPDWRFIIGIVDKNTQNVDLSFLNSEVLWVEEIEIPYLEKMAEKYTIVELLTSVKPYYFKWLLTRYTDTENIIYFDPDILIFQPLTDLLQKLQYSDIIVTPHFTKPINDHFLPTELHVMQTGIYNLGFLAVRNTANTMDMLHWWCDRLKDKCYINLSRGLFVDQLCMNLAPVYFDKVLIDKYPGYNMAHWNIHERQISKEEDGYRVNGVPLVFFHFSHYNPLQPNQIAAFHNRFHFDTRADLKELYDSYRDMLLQNNYAGLKKIPCFYSKREHQKKWKKDIDNLLRFSSRILLPSSFMRRLSKIMKE